jgi:hypothetical protein
MRMSAGFGLNLRSWPPIPSHFSEHVSSTLFDGRRANRWIAHYQFQLLQSE